MVGSDREVSEIIGTDVDVTGQYAARQRLEKTLAALQESEQRFRYYAETASDWLWDTGPDHLCTRLSEHASAAGLWAAELIGLARWDVACDVEAEPQKWQLHRATLAAHLPFRDLIYPVIRSFSHSAEYVQLSVADCGVGIAEDDTARVLDPFFTTKSSGLEWDFRSAVQSWRLTEGVCHLPASRSRLRRFNSLCRCVGKPCRDWTF